MNYVKQDLIDGVKQVLQNLSGSAITASAYDTAWIARIPSLADRSQPMFPHCLAWIIQNQLPDGSWGAENLEYFHDRIISTLNCIATLKRWSSAPDAVYRGEQYIRQNLENLQKDTYATVGFELIFPVLLTIAQVLQLDLPYDSPVIQAINDKREAKLKKIPLELVYQYPTTILHSLEGLAGSIEFDRIFAHQAANGSFLNSPSATAFVYMNTEDEESLRYLRETLDVFGNFAPANYPIDIFETLWVLNDIHYLNLESHFEAEIQEKLDYVEKHWTKHGLPWSKFVQIPDLDDTAMGFKLLRMHGRDVSGEVFQKFYDGNRFFCFPGELDSSVSHLVNLMDASKLRYADEAILEQAEAYCRDYLRQQLEQPVIEDKWVTGRDYKSIIRHGLDANPFYTAPFVEQQKRLRLYEDSIMRGHWIDKSIYYVPPINMQDLLDLALVEQQGQRGLFQTELQTLEAWVDTHPSILKARALSTLFISFNIFPKPDQATARWLFSKATLYLFAADDLLDSNELTLDQQQHLMTVLEKRDASHVQLSNPSHVAKVQDLVAVIDEIIADVSRVQNRDMTAVMAQIWKDNLAANKLETTHKYNRTQPTFEDYLDYGKVTIGTPLALAVAFYGLQPNLPDVTQTAPYSEIINLGAEMTRLLNDIRSFDREQAEGKINSIHILMAEGMTKEAAVAYIHNDYTNTMRMLQAEALKKDAFQPFCQLVFNLCRTTAWFYQANDFHDYQTELLAVH